MEAQRLGCCLSGGAGRVPKGPAHGAGHDPDIPFLLRKNAHTFSDPTRAADAPSEIPAPCRTCTAPQAPFPRALGRTPYSPILLPLGAGRNRRGACWGLLFLSTPEIGQGRPRASSMEGSPLAEPCMATAPPTPAQAERVVTSAHFPAGPRPWQWVQTAASRAPPTSSEPELPAPTP